MKQPVVLFLSITILAVAFAGLVGSMLNYQVNTSQTRALMDIDRRLDALEQKR